MALISFFYNKASQINDIVVDAVISESQSHTADIPTDPTEDGTIISNMIIIKPYTVKIEGLITDTPWSGGITNNSAEGYEKLLALFLAKQKFDVITDRNIYIDVFFTEFDINRTADTGAALNFTATFQPILTVTAKYIIIPRAKVQDDKRDVIPSTIDKGVQQKAKADDLKKEGSALTKIYDNYFKKHLKYGNTTNAVGV
jgi:hypothetical protein